MSIFKCKMCGGSIEFEQGSTIGVCEYCGTKQTLPRLDDEKRANLYDRANHFRRNNEYDKAMSIYEQILNEDNTDAEAYWSLVLCRYGIEYVEDPASHKRIPTVNRAQFTSVFADEDYKSALQYADGEQKAIYESEAKAIDDIQKGILSISQKEDPFDVFICYKETDANGRRTQDSVLANDLYHQLTQEGFKVFFSRITLEDKLGTAYEPYIFAALNSSKVMVVLGTKPEHFNAVWVKNEWSRYLALIKNGAKKMLIPAYRDMDPYDLPEEFSHLQAQDMSKLGFMQDLIRGIKKILSADAPKETVVASVDNASTAPLLERIFLFLEDGNWQEANQYCEKVLDIDPKNAKAYLGKLMAELQVRKQDALKDCAQPFDGNINYQKAVRFAEPALADSLKGYVAHINERNESARLASIYDKAVKAMQQADTDAAYKSAADALATIPGYKDADTLAAQCREKEEVLRRERLAKEEAARIEREKTKKKIRKIAAIVLPSIAAVVAFLLLLTNVIIPNSKYNAAVALKDEGKYDEAIAAFEAMDGYKDSAAQIPECKYSKAAALMDEGKYEDAARVFDALDGYKDSGAQVEACKTALKDIDYDAAVALMNEGRYDDAITAFSAMGGYRDSDAQIEACHTALKDIDYDAAVALINDGNIIDAYESLIAMDGYKDSAEKADGIFVQYKAEKLKLAEVGDTVLFGAYEQDNDLSNGKEEIEWLVLAKEDGKLLVISKYALDWQYYHSTQTNITWEKCSLRSWLNGKFMNNAFSSKEQAMIATTYVSADRNPEYGTNPGNATNDKVFLLSITEAEKYFRTDEDRRCRATAYAFAQGAPIPGFINWWLRSPGADQHSAAFVLDHGPIFYGWVYSYGSDGRSACAVRPAMWINLDSKLSG